jgi:hypothetical protein
MLVRRRVTKAGQKVNDEIPKTSTTTGDGPVLFHITQVHTPESCPRDEGGSNSLYDHNVPGIRLVGRYGANAQHTLFLVVEADDVTPSTSSSGPASSGARARSRR